MTKIDNPTDIRKSLLGNGYTPLANLDKRCVLTGWPKLAVDEALIDSAAWARGKHQATGVRIDKPLAVIDSDITDPVLQDKVLACWMDYLPAVFDPPEGIPLLERGTTASCKLAFFVRCKKPFGRKATRAYRRPGGGDAQKIEIYGGRSPRQFGFVGAHKIDRDGTPLSTYIWEYDSPVDVPLASLPMLDEDQFNALIKLADAVLKESGLELVPEKQGDAKEGEPVYDLTEDMVFECEDGNYTLPELKAAVGSGSMRCSASWWDASSENPTRCRVRMTKSGLMVFDHDTWTKHYEAAHKPAEPADLGAALGTLQARVAPGAALPKPEDGDPGSLWAAWIRENYAFCANLKNPVVPLDATALSAGISVANFRLDHARYSDRVVTGNKVTYVNPVDMWILDKGRVSVEGLVMRPDRETPLFREENRQWVNIYKPPVHDAVGGDASACHELIRQIAPIDSERTSWFMPWLAYKFRNPAVPGPATFSIANDRYGTGRGTFARLLGKLFGERYVRTIPFHIFAGKSTQAQYTNWMAETLFVVVNETTELGGQTRWAAGHDAAAHIRDLIEPRASPREIIMKGITSRQMLSYCTFFIAGNAIDGIPLPESDRRCGVFAAGETQPQAFWDRINSSLDNPADVAAFVRDLLAVDLSGYSPYSPPPITEAKMLVVEAGLSALDRAISEVMLLLQARGTDLFSVKHVIDGVAGLIDPHEELHSNWRTTVRLILGRKSIHRIGVPNGINWQPKFGEGRFATYAWTAKGKEKWNTAHPVHVKAELERCGTLDNSFASVIKDLAAQVAQRAN